MAIETFNRYENKYQISEDTFFRLQGRLCEYMETDAYNKAHFTYPICNIYYDSEDHYLIRTSLSKPSYREKLRLRSYGTPSEGQSVYVEIKKKFRGLTNKRRSGLKLDEAYDFLATGNIPVHRPYMNKQVLREVQYMLSQRELRPVVYLSYERRAFFGDGDSDLRLSFDTAIMTRRNDLRLEAGVYGESLLEDGKWIMEIKTAQAIPLWLTRILSEYKIYPARFSKYGSEYQSALVPAAQQHAEDQSALVPAAQQHAGYQSALVPTAQRYAEYQSALVPAALQQAEYQATPNTRLQGLKKGKIPCSNQYLTQQRIQQAFQ